jgi:tRNA threonylcarbamoyladenosine biosynthesis protein TsaB
MTSMKIIAFETSSETLSVTVADGDRLYSEDIANAGRENSELALPTMHALLASSNVKLQDVDVIAYGQGPGSFTGVRIACGLAQGLAYGLGVRVFGAPTTRILAVQVSAQVPPHEAARIVVAIDARMNEVYFAVYERDTHGDAELREVIAPMLCAPSNLPALTQSSENASLYGVGSAFDSPQLAAPVLSALPALRVVTPSQPQSSALARLASERIARLGDAATMEAADAAPLYLRNNVAMTIDERRALAESKAADAKAAESRTAESKSTSQMSVSA